MVELRVEPKMGKVFKKSRKVFHSSITWVNVYMVGANVAATKGILKLFIFSALYYKILFGDANSLLSFSEIRNFSSTVLINVST